VLPVLSAQTETNPAPIPDNTTQLLQLSSIDTTPAFVQYIKTQPAHIQHYLKDVQWTRGPAYCASIIDTLVNDEDHLLLVSDGSSVEGLHMSFGGILGTLQGQVLARFKGIATGQPSSHRAEATGVLVGALLLIHLANYRDTNLQHVSVVVCCDNQSVIKRLNDRHKYDKVYPNSTLRPDWDLIEEAVQRYRDLRLRHLKFEWVRGHQDTLPSDAILTVQAEFNIMADNLATSVLHDSEDHEASLTPLLPETRCTLEVKGISIHGNYQRYLRRAGSERSLYNYLSLKHGWNKETWEDIDWESFRMAAKNYPTTEVHLLKLVHDKLPFRGHTSKFQPWVPSHCHYCQHPDNMDHLQCTDCNPVSGKFRNDIKQTMRLYLESRKCSRHFTSLFTHALDCWFLGNVSVTLVTTEIYSRQADIGWRLFTRGFLTKQWRITLERTHVTTPDAPPMSSAVSIPIIAGAIKLVWQATGKLWLSHLETLHRRDDETLSPVTTADLRSKVKWMHSMKSQVPSARDYYFHDDVDDYLRTATPETMSNYISQYLPAIQHLKRRPITMNTSPSASDNERDNDSDTVSDASSETHIPQIHQDLGEPAHRKRNRRRVAAGIVHTIRNWFTPGAP